MMSRTGSAPERRDHAERDRLDDVRADNVQAARAPLSAKANVPVKSRTEARGSRLTGILTHPWSFRARRARRRPAQCPVEGWLETGANVAEWLTGMSSAIRPASELARSLGVDAANAPVRVREPSACGMSEKSSLAVWSGSSCAVPELAAERGRDLR